MKKVSFSDKKELYYYDRNIRGCVKYTLEDLSTPEKYVGKSLTWYEEIYTSRPLLIKAVVTEYNKSNWWFKFKILNETTNDSYWVSENFLKKKVERIKIENDFGV